MILVIFTVLRIFAIFLLFYTVIIIAKFFSSQEGDQDIYPSNESYERYNRRKEVLSDIDEALFKAFKMFGLSPLDSYSKVSYKYFIIRKSIINSTLPENLKMAKLREIDELFNLISEYYKRTGKI